MISTEVVFFSMKGCHFCDKAKKLLKKHISSCKIIVKDSSEAPNGVQGFPYFLNTKNNNHFSGLPESSKQLFDNLDGNLKGGAKNEESAKNKFLKRARNPGFSNVKNPALAQVGRAMQGKAKQSGYKGFPREVGEIILENADIGRVETAIQNKMVQQKQQIEDVLTCVKACWERLITNLNENDRFKIDILEQVSKRRLPDHINDMIFEFEEIYRRQFNIYEKLESAIADYI
jgi:glutaredoxin